jgi:hypothetical protein
MNIGTSTYPDDICRHRQELSAEALQLLARRTGIGLFIPA